MSETKETFDIAITCGVFDLLHEGHAELFDEMNKLAALKIAIVHDDGSTYLNKGRVPAQPLAQRMEAVARMTGTIVFPCYDSDPSLVIAWLAGALGRDQKVVYMRGDDWQDFPGRKEIVEHTTWHLKFKPYKQGVSSTEIRKTL